MNEAEWERSRSRWRQAPQEWEHLTWGKELKGDAFVDIVLRHAEFVPQTAVLEIGPGYGRLLRAFLEREVPFASYCALDLAEDTCAYLRDQFPLDNVSFVHGDVETATYDRRFDVVLSSATFEHLYPSMEKALEHLSTVAKPAGLFFIDVPEGASTVFPGDTYIRHYAKEELLEILERVGLEHVAFESVEHAPGIVNLLMVARKP